MGVYRDNKRVACEGAINGVARPIAKDLVSDPYTAALGVLNRRCRYHRVLRQRVTHDRCLLGAGALTALLPPQDTASAARAARCGTHVWGGALVAHRAADAKGEARRDLRAARATLGNVS